MKKLIPFLMLIMASTAIISCGGKAGKKTGNTDSPASETDQKNDKVSTETAIENAVKSATENEENNEDGAFLRSNAIEKAFDALKAMDKFKGKKIMVFQTITFGKGTIMLSISDPAKPENIDHYEYRDGTWGEPAPVQLSGDGKLSDNLTDLDEINYKAIPNMMKITDEKAKGIEGSKVDDGITFLYMPALNMRVFQLQIAGTRESYLLRFDKTGTLTKFEKN